MVSIVIKAGDLMISPAEAVYSGVAVILEDLEEVVSVEAGQVAPGKLGQLLQMLELPIKRISATLN